MSGQSILDTPENVLKFIGLGFIHEPILSTSLCFSCTISIMLFIQLYSKLLKEEIL